MKTQLQRIRKEKGFKSAKAFADSIGMNTHTYTDYEQGRRMFSLETAWEFADALECTLDELAGLGRSRPGGAQRLLRVDEQRGARRARGVRAADERVA